MGIFGYLALPCSFRSIDCGENGQCEDMFDDYSCLCGEGSLNMKENNPQSSCIIDNCYNVDCDQGICEATLNSYSCLCVERAKNANKTNSKSMCQCEPGSRFNIIWK